MKPIKDLIDDYKCRHHTNPNIGIIAYGKVDTMIMKSCPIGTYYSNKGLHCNRCHKHKCELEDRIGVRYRLLGDNNCNTRILLDKPICLFDKLNELESMEINPYLLFTDEDEELVSEVINAFFANKNPLSVKSSKGHYLRRPL